MWKEMTYRVLLCLQHTWLKSNTGLYCLQTLQPFVATGFAGALQEGSQTTAAPAPWLSQQEVLGTGPGGCAPWTGPHCLDAGSHQFHAAPPLCPSHSWTQAVCKPRRPWDSWWMAHPSAPWKPYPCARQPGEELGLTCTIYSAGDVRADVE